MRKRYIQMNDGSLAEVSDDYRAPLRAEAAHNIIPDIGEYRSMVTGEVITSRSKHREHLKMHGMVEIGNETKHLKPFGTYTPPKGLKDTLIRVVNEKMR